MIKTRKFSLPGFGPITLISATENGVGEMTDCFWIRDQAQICLIYLNLWLMDRQKYQSEGEISRLVLLSLLALMSTPSQLQRFQKMIQSSDLKYKTNPNNWPHIFMHQANLATAKTEPWSHKQDAWQMLFVAVFQAWEKNLIRLADLTPAGKKFLALVPDFLQAVEFWHCPNSGSWEEIEAIRSSVLGWDLTVLELYQKYQGQPGFEFLNSQADLTKLIKLGKTQLLKQLPFESPAYPASDPRHRRADAALIYLLQLNWPEKLGRPELEAQILEQILTLVDPKTQAIRRYLGDSYQRQDFWTPAVQQKLKAMYSSPTSEFSGIEHFIGRDKIVPQGREAAWVHFVFQLSCWAADKYQTTKDPKYLKLQQNFFQTGLKLIPQPGDQMVKYSSGGVSLMPAPQVVPECWVTLTLNGREKILPGPFTPLNWATAYYQLAKAKNNACFRYL